MKVTIKSVLMLALPYIITMFLPIVLIFLLINAIQDEYQGKIIGRGYNRRTTDKSTLAHAEIIAIKKACKKMGDWRLEDCTMYVTLEPCQMCAGAIVQARVKKVVIGCMNPKAGCAGSILNVLQMDAFNHQVEVERGVLEEECSRMLTSFFKSLRQKLKAEKEENKKALV